MPAPLKDAIYRGLREASSNAVRHSNADRIKVHLINRGDRCEFSIKNKRNGFNRPGAGSDGSNSKGPRLLSMRQGAELAGGSEVMKSGAEQEVRVCVWWPSSAAKNGYPDVPGCPKLGVQRAAVVNGGIEVRGCYCST